MKAVPHLKAIVLKSKMSDALKQVKIWAVCVVISPCRVSQLGWTYAPLLRLPYFQALVPAAEVLLMTLKGSIMRLDKTGWPYY